ncbi:hypothetical protein [Streptomyces sp. CAI-85]|uniref:hypothetical protein n=1 Tax=Streptomyces sp. CAI-85 TaxID=1472662 RepID=UPI001587891E|nr:hypothetical protein [Streptomyces sp. CAI-85]NUV64306.1 hypothetical protein [Streptomyces sp. CAI-85]
MMRDAVTCDREDCLAVFLEPLGLPEGRTTEDAAREAGWEHGEAGHTCPGCVAGRGPVLERGECERCLGATVDRTTPDQGEANVCHYCGRVAPYPPGSGEW